MLAMELSSVLVFFMCLSFAWCKSIHGIRVRRGAEELSLPDNATTIRESISTSFSCLGRGYGYYADPDNDCQLFHVCLPLVYSSEEPMQTLMWSFICPQETVFNQETFTCMRTDESIPCQDSARFYSLNDHFGERPVKLNPSSLDNDDDNSNNQQIDSSIDPNTRVYHRLSSIDSVIDHRNNIEVYEPNQDGPSPDESFRSFGEDDENFSYTDSE